MTGFNVKPSEVVSRDQPHRARIIGAHGKPVIFLHPKDFCGTLIELEQV